MTVSAIVLAGGRSARFGGDKLAADLDGQPVLALAVAAVRSVADETIVVGRTSGPEGVRFVADERPGAGPLGGVAAGLRAATGDIALIVGGDMPRLEPGVLRLLLDRLEGRGGAVATVLEDAGIPRPLPIAALAGPALVAAAAGLASGDRSLRGFLARLTLTTVPEGDWRAIDPRGGTLLDVDTRSDLERLRRRD